jgi:hypothetical protein
VLAVLRFPVALQVGCEVTRLHAERTDALGRLGEAVRVTAGLASTERGATRFCELAAFLAEPRERAWDFFDPADRFDEALVLV